jgi:hypothetical protein
MREKLQPIAEDRIKADPVKIVTSCISRIRDSGQERALLQSLQCERVSCCRQFSKSGSIRSPDAWRNPLAELDT